MVGELHFPAVVKKLLQFYNVLSNNIPQIILQIFCAYMYVIDLVFGTNGILRHERLGRQLDLCPKQRGQNMR